MKIIGRALLAVGMLSVAVPAMAKGFTAKTTLMTKTTLATKHVALKSATGKTAVTVRRTSSIGRKAYGWDTVTRLGTWVDDRGITQRGGLYTAPANPKAGDTAWAADNGLTGTYIKYDGKQWVATDMYGPRNMVGPRGNQVPIAGQ